MNIVIIWKYIHIKLRFGQIIKALHSSEQLKSWLKDKQDGLLSYASLLVQKLHPHSGITSKTYKPTFHSGHLSCNTSYGSAATIQVFHLPWQKYSYSTRSCYRMLWTLTIFILFYFIFILDNKEACDIAVTWQVTWCDVIGLECGGRI